MPESYSILKPTGGSLVDDLAGSNTSDLSLKHSQVKLGRELRELPGDNVASPGLFYPDKNISFCRQKLLSVIADNQTLSRKNRSQTCPTDATLASSGL